MTVYATRPASSVPAWKSKSFTFKLIFIKVRGLTLSLVPVGCAGNVQLAPPNYRPVTDERQSLFKRQLLWCISREGSHTNLVALLPAGSQGWAQLPVSSSRLARGETQLAFVWTAFPQRTHRVLHLHSIQIFFCFVHTYWSFYIWIAWEHWQMFKIERHHWSAKEDPGPCLSSSFVTATVRRGWCNAVISCTLTWSNQYNS